MSRRAPAILALLLVLAAAPPASGAEAFLTLASTTSTRDSGLFDAILPLFEARTGIEVRVVAVGSGRALELGRRGDVDALLVHDRAAEERFLAEGHGLLRRDVMWNDFVLLGPPDDPAGIRGVRDAAAALDRIRAADAPFASRGDDSGTHAAELRLWEAAGGAPDAGRAPWYRETGSGMGATLNVAAELGAYTLADRGTWLAFRNRRDLEILVEGDPRLRNPYGVIVVDPARHTHAKGDAARRFADWLVSEEAQRAIGEFRVGGEALFFPAVEPSRRPGRGAD